MARGLSHRARRGAIYGAIVAVTGVSALGGNRAAFGQVSGSWASLNPGSWSVGSNWSSNPLYPDGGGTATVGVGTFISFDTNVSLGRLVFAGRSTIQGGSGSLNLVGPGIVETSFTLDAGPIIAFGFTPTLGAHITGSVGLRKTGPGPLGIATSSYTGGTFIDDGTL